MNEELIMQAAEDVRKFARGKYPQLSDIEISVVFKTVGNLMENIIAMKSVAIMTKNYIEKNT